MIKYITATLAVALLSLQITQSQSHQICAGIVPENDLYIPPFTTFSLDEETPGITQEQFNKVIDMADVAYKNIVADMGGELTWQRNWDDGTVNAFANREGENDNTWVVAMFGGLARHFTVTEDAFMMVVCHELGHHIGGAPKYNGEDWATNEGQADYYAGMKCMRRILLNENNVEYVKNLDFVDPFAERLCKEQFSGSVQLPIDSLSTVENEIAICIRAAMGGYHLAQLFKELRGQRLELDFQTPDQNEVVETADRHPAPQCRMDTYLQGSICNVSYTQDVDQRDPNVGTCNRAERFSQGLRPRCWYRPTDAELATELNL